MAHILFSPLNWGLGHATRDIPIIKKLLDQHHEVTIAACGNAQAVLKKVNAMNNSIDIKNELDNFMKEFAPEFRYKEIR